MSSFILKLLALIAMILDHIACTFGWEGWDLLSIDANVLRYIGRVSFPIFAFCIVNGWKHTHDKQKYFTNLLCCALISQVPFSLAFYMPNKMPIGTSENAFTFLFNPTFLLVAFMCVLTYWYFGLHRKANKSLFVLGAVCLLPTVFVKMNYMWVLSDSLNVLYTLILGIVAVYVIETVKSKNLRWWEYIWLIGVFILAAIAYCPMADYGTDFMGLLLVVALYAVQKWKPAQSLCVAIWGCVLYGIVIGNWNNALATLFPAVMILFYDQKSGLKNKFSKRLFYVLYPTHILIIGLINAYLRLS